MAKTTIEKGITITFRGDTTKFNESVKSVNNELKGVKSELNMLNRELKLDPNNLEKLSKKMDTLKEKEKLLKEEINAYKDAMKQLDPSSEAFKQAEMKCRSLEIEVERTKRQIQDMGGSKIGLSLNVLSNKLSSTGSKISEVGKELSGFSAVAAGALTALGGLSLKTASYADEINTLSKTTNLSTQTLQVFSQVAELIDVDLNTIAKSAQYVAKNMDTTKAQEAYRKLGISVKDVNGQYRNSEDVMFEALTALQSVTNETEKTQLAIDLFGKSGTALGTIINDTSVDVKELTNRVKENGAILSQDELDALNDVQDNLDTFKMKIKSTGTKLASDFGEPLKKITDKLNELAERVDDFVSKLSDDQKEKLLAVIAVIALVPPLIIAVGTTLSSLATIVKTCSVAIAFFQTQTGLITLGITALVAVIVLLWLNWDKVTESIKKLWEQFKKTKFVTDLTAFFENLKNVIDKVVSKIKDAVKWIGDLANGVGKFFKSGFDKIGKLFGSGGFGNMNVYASGGYGALELHTTINVNNNGSNISAYQAQQFGREIVEYVNENLGRRI